MKMQSVILPGQRKYTFSCRKQENAIEKSFSHVMLTAVVKMFFDRKGELLKMGSGFCPKCNDILTGDNLVCIPGKNLLLCRNCAEKIFRKCEECGQYTASPDLADIEGKSICIWCIQKKYVFCPHCRKFLSLDDAVDFHGYYLCRSCRDDRLKECTVCGCTGEKDDFENVTVKGKRVSVCPACQEKYFAACSLCGKPKPKEILQQWNDSYYCPVCYKKSFISCASCGTILQKSSACRVKAPDGTVLKLCPSCRNTYRQCSMCNKYFPPEKVSMSGGKRYCCDCLTLYLDRLRSEQLNLVQNIGMMALGAWAGNSLADSLFSPPESSPENTLSTATDYEFEESWDEE